MVAKAGGWGPNKYRQPPRQQRVRTVRLMHQDRDYRDGAKSMPH